MPSVARPAPAATSLKTAGLWAIFAIFSLGFAPGAHAAADHTYADDSLEDILLLQHQARQTTPATTQAAPAPQLQPTIAQQLVRAPLTLPLAAPQPTTAPSPTEDMPPPAQTAPDTRLLTIGADNAADTSPLTAAQRLVEAAQNIPEDKWFETAVDALAQNRVIMAQQLQKQLQGSNADAATYIQAGLLTLDGSYSEALKKLGALYTQDSPAGHLASLLRGKLLLTMAQLAQVNGDADDAEADLRTWLKDHVNDGNRPWFEHLMRIQARLRGKQLADLDTTKPFRVALLVPLTGTYAPVGDAMLKAASLNLFEHTSMNLDLRPYDTQGTAEGAKQAFTAATAAGADMVLGPLLSGSVRAVAPIAQAQGQPIIGFSSDSTVAAPPTVLLLSFTPTEQARLMADQAIHEGRSTFAILAPDNIYGHDMSQAFATEVQSLGGHLVRTIFYDPAAVDLTPALRQLVHFSDAVKALNKEKAELAAEYKKLGKAMPKEDLRRMRHLRRAKPNPVVDYDALFVPASAQDMPLIAPQLAFYNTAGTQVALYGTALWHSPALMKTHGEYLQKAEFPAPSSRAAKTFTQAYQKTFGTAPDGLATLAYDAMDVVADMVANGMTRGTELPAMVRQGYGFTGASGPFRFTRAGTTRHTYDILQVHHGLTPVLTASPLVLPPDLPAWADAQHTGNSGGWSFNPFNFWH